MKNKLSADPTALILGIVSLVIILFGCCCGFFAILSLILSIIGLVLAVKSLNEFDANPDNYSVQSRKNVYAAKVVCIVGTALSAIFMIVFGFIFFIYQINFVDKIKDIIDQRTEVNELKIDTTNVNDSLNNIYIDIDSTSNDSIKIESIKNR